METNFCLYAYLAFITIAVFGVFWFLYSYYAFMQDDFTLKSYAFARKGLLLTIVLSLIVGYFACSRFTYQFFGQENLFEAMLAI